MTGLSAYSTSGGSADVIDYPLAETHPIDDPQDVEEAVAFAIEALEAATKLEEIGLDEKGADKVAQKLLNVAVEAYIEKFDIPIAALEANHVVLFSEPPQEDSRTTHIGDDPASDHEEAVRQSKLKKVILYLYAIVERIFKAIFDLLRSQKITARRLIPLTKQYIGESDSLSSAVAGQLNIKDRSLMLALHMEGTVPKKIPELFDNLAEVFEKQHQHTAVTEVIQLVSAVKEKNPEKVAEKAKVLRKVLEEGLKASMAEVDPSKMAVFSEKKSDAATYYATEPMFGQNYIVGIIGNDVNQDGDFRFTCAIRRDTEVPLRVGAFPVLSPDEIRHVCRTSLRVCENIIRFSRDEDLLQKVLREATFLTTKEPDKAAVAALRDIAAVGQNSYIVHLRYTTRTMQALLRWCAASIKRYEGLNQNGR